MGKQRVCVVGGGVIGLTSALRLLEEVGGVEVVVMSEEFSPHTTGDGSAGWVRPFLAGNTPIHLMRRWTAETTAFVMRLGQSAEGGVLGIYTETGYDITKRPVEEPYWKDLVFGFRRMTDAELSQYEGYTFGYAYTTVMTECKKYLPWVKQRFESLGGRCIQRKIENLSELHGQYDVIVNCTGVGARELVNDAEVQSIKGQLIRVEAPWIKHFVLADDDDLYILVAADSVALGGTHQTGVMQRHIDADERRRIWEGCCRLMPSLQRAKVLEEWAGLRPGRTAIRLEAELRDLGHGKTLPVVHNYGHGGSGVTLHWGCAGDAVKLVQGLLKSAPGAARAKI